MKHLRLLSLSTVVVALASTALACSFDTNSSTTPRLNETVDTVPQDPLEQMVLAFEGGYSRAQIKASLDEAMKLYELPPTNENYSRAGSALVSLRKFAQDRGCMFKCNEMTILDYMIRSHVPGAAMSFPDAAGIATTALIVDVP